MVNPTSFPALFSSLAIAPMIDWTNTHFRIFMRILAPQSLLYTEMQTPGAVFNNSKRALAYNPLEKPVALQIGGADKEALVQCAQMAEACGFDEINLNLGCPSDRVQAGRFGACLMAEPQHVAACIRAIKEAVQIPVTAKTRIGIDNKDSYEFFASFVHGLVEAGCDKLIVHARKAWLHGLNPKQNRTIPPVCYSYVYQIKKELPNIPVVINGNIQTLAEVKTHLEQVDGVMLGRLACQNPYAIARIHHGLYPHVSLPSRSAVLKDYCAYAQSVAEKGVPLTLLTKPILNMAYGLPKAKWWKAKLMTLLQERAWKRLHEVPTWLALLEDEVTASLNE